MYVGTQRRRCAQIMLLEEEVVLVAEGRPTSSNASTTTTAATALSWYLCPQICKKEVVHVNLNFPSVKHV